MKVILWATLSANGKAVLHRFVEAVWLPHAEQEPGEERLRAVIADWGRWVRGDVLPGGCPIAQLVDDLGAEQDPAYERLAQAQTKWLQMLAREFAAVGERLRVNAADEQAAFELYSLMMGYGFARKHLHDAGAAHKLQAAVDRLIDAARE